MSGELKGVLSGLYPRQRAQALRDAAQLPDSGARLARIDRITDALVREGWARSRSSLERHAEWVAQRAIEVARRRDVLAHKKYMAMHPDVDHGREGGQ